MCDNGDRSASKLYNPEYLKSRNVNVEGEDINEIIERFKKIPIQETKFKEYKD